MLGPWIVQRICELEGLHTAVEASARLITVGSIMRMGTEGDVVWGTGVSGKSLSRGAFPRLDVRAVRGPISARHLRNSGNEVPDIFGDPALLIPSLWSDLELGIRRRSTGTVFVPNLFDAPVFPKEALNPRGRFLDKIRVIASADLVIASSLHAIVIAEAYGVPVVPVSGSEPELKYHDYFEGTQRDAPAFAPSWQAALNLAPLSPLLSWDPAKLLAAFPRDLWLSDS
ncbi:polysaccharide pyruvyl transferase family protein [Microbacterium sp. 18062]|uniref:polysaccharide pyruvyl transferase family protein n=1 Tax=Microbacterium sp. 18062 TaxID=2681410 RepID=UPI001F42FC78|nr:polysaccharide pyruvyl transferase family protein [Microbacterium sp. 18062]